jgi:hypothetical protein
MGDPAALGRVLVVVGLVVVVIGVLLAVGSPLGRLPGDIAIRGDRWGFYFPLATSIVISIVLTLALWAASAIANR